MAILLFFHTCLERLLSKMVEGKAVFHLVSLRSLYTTDTIQNKIKILSLSTFYKETRATPKVKIYAFKFISFFFFFIYPKEYSIGFLLFGFLSQ